MTTTEPTVAPRPFTPGWFRALIAGRTPLTDPRALVSSIALHAGLLALTSLVVCNASNAAPEAEPTARVVRGELDGIDNRAHEESFERRRW